MGRTYVPGDVRQGEGTTETTPAQIVVWVALTSRHQASGLPSLSSQQGEGVQDVFILEVFRSECSLTQGDRFTAEAERSRRYFCRRQHCGVQRAR